MLELLLNPSHQFFKFKFEDGSFDVGHDSVFSNHPSEKMSSEEEYILYWPNDSSVSTRKVSRKTKCRDWLQESCTQALYIYRSLLDCNFIDLISYLILDEKLSLK